MACQIQVGYLLGLGDRHPSNLMLDRYSGKLLHIDFGDCFEASMNREKFPERVRNFSSQPAVLSASFAGASSTMAFFDKVPFEVLAISLLCYVQVPFRLTRMMVKAMEVSGVEGNFRSASLLICLS